MGTVPMDPFYAKLSTLNVYFFQDITLKSLRICFLIKKSFAKIKFLQKKDNLSQMNKHRKIFPNIKKNLTRNYDRTGEF